MVNKFERNSLDILNLLKFHKQESNGNTILKWGLEGLKLVGIKNCQQIHEKLQELNCKVN